MIESTEHHHRPQEGFKYEENLNKVLKEYGISTGVVAGASHDKPDITLVSHKKQAGCELKLAPTAAGSLVMWYVENKWTYGGGWKDSSEKVFMHDLGEKMGVLREMNDSGANGKNWRDKRPILRNTVSGSKEYIGVSAHDHMAAYNLDKAQFGGPNEVHINVPGKAISDYYNQKNTYYLNVGTHGFYLLNGSDPLKVNDALRQIRKPSVPDFSISVKAMIRVRIQDKGSGSYQFVMALQFQGVKRSDYNIGPIKVGTKSEIDVPKLKADPILLAFKS